MFRAALIIGFAVLLNCTTAPQAHAFGRGQFKDPKLAAVSGIYETHYTGPDLQNEEAVLRICPKLVILEVVNGDTRVATPEDTALIEHQIALDAATGRTERPARRVKLQFKRYSGIEPAPYAAPVPDAKAPGGSRPPNFTYEVVSEQVAVNGELGVRTLLTGNLEQPPNDGKKPREIEISTLYHPVGELLSIESENNNADVTLDLINRGQFIAESCELHKLQAQPNSN